MMIVGLAKSTASSLAASNADMSHARTANPIDASRSGSLAASSSTSEMLAMTSHSVTSREGNLASSSSVNGILASDSTPHAGREGCLPMEDKIPLTWDEKGEVVQYPVGHHNTVAPFPHCVVWGLSHNTVAQKFKAPLKATRIYNISEWSLVYTNSLWHFQFLGDWHGTQDIYSEAGNAPQPST
ncbi:hypothetical protein BS47DRAFT_1366177 [Hydnum rufescens UP504]|uniref:Uncharacterized protein n=1 Tax=Hydnum rufescens UP504 TaxID=1448309 RepID=A0A9P6DNM3_9AGAM|nr:hypothetical protein BS47DRAFT_1366177 [Hydnum rufescens UP504]